ncbi:MAG: hypothetical protein ABEJ07_03155 [Candidatus Nanohaloarchaea archaeon]
MERYAAAAAITGLVVFSATFAIDIQQTGWEKQVLDKDVTGFLDVEAGNGKVHLVFRDAGGLKYISGRKSGLLETVAGRNWRRETVAQGEHTGSYASLEIISGKPMVAYQYAQVGSERAMLATRENGNWSRETVSEQEGLNVGMYSELVSYRGSPAVLYTDDFEESLMLATRAGDGWNRESLESDAGLLTDAEFCGGEVKAAFTNRTTNRLMLGSYDGTWSSERLNVTATSLDLSMQQGCDPFVLMHSDSEDAVLAYDSGALNKIGSSQFSRVSSDISGDTHVAFNQRGQGLRYGVYGNGSYPVIAGGRNTGGYNDLEVDGSSKYVVYTNGTDLVYAEYTPMESRLARTAVDMAKVIGLSLLLLAGLIVKTRVKSLARDLLARMHPRYQGLHRFIGAKEK